jgi:hypothetical protein
VQSNKGEGGSATAMEEVNAVARERMDTIRGLGYFFCSLGYR